MSQHSAQMQYGLKMLQLLQRLLPLVYYLSVYLSMGSTMSMHPVAFRMPFGFGLNGEHRSKPLPLILINRLVSLFR